MNFGMLADFSVWMEVTAGILIAFLVVGLYVAIKCFHKVSQGEALIRNGMGGTKVTFAPVPVGHGGALEAAEGRAALAAFISAR